MTLIHTTLTYSETDFVSTPFTSELPTAAGGFEGRVIVTGVCSSLTYSETDFATTPFTQDQRICAFGYEGLFIARTDQGRGFQGQPSIQGTQSAGFQGRAQLEALQGEGFQGRITFVESFGFQGRIVLYNTKLTRVMCEFPTRGTTSNNWSGTASAPGDFDLENLDNDIPESVYRTDGQVTGVVITTDCGAGQSVVTDTIAILNHNMTRDAFVRVLGSNDPSFATPNFDETLDVTTQNMYWIAEDLPQNGSRYFRYQFDDPGNPAGYLQMGIILQGPTEIFQNECTVETIPFTLTDFADAVQTEGFSNVENSRALKRQVTLDFRLLDGEGRGFGILRNIFEQYRTTHKCLWIPTPDIDDQTITGRFAVFGKITALPTEQHNWRDTREFVDVSITIDEAK